MWHKPCRTFHPWCPCIKTRCLYTCRRGNHLLLGIRQPKQNIPSHLPRSLEDIMLSVQFISTQNVWLYLIKMLTMSGDHWWLILHVPETVLVDNNLHCFKPIPTHSNSFAGNVSRMWLNIHSAWAQDLGQLAEAWWMTSIWRSNRKVVTDLLPCWPCVFLSCLYISRLYGPVASKTIQ